MDLLESHNLKLGMISIDLYSQPRWAMGSITSPDPKIRSQALSAIKSGMELGSQLGLDQVNLWLGQDGYDYPFQQDYLRAWDSISSAISECADHLPQLKLFLEYKLKEPRTHLLLNTGSKVLMLLEKLKKPNLGITIDLGHALMCYENPAEIACLAHGLGYPIYLHFNDNYRDWDHDLIPGTVHLWELFELIVWLRALGYTNWWGLDIYPYREDPAQACQQAIQILSRLIELADKLGPQRILAQIREAQITQLIPWLFEQVLRR